MPLTRIPVSPQTLKWARMTAGYTQDAAAKRIGCSATSYERWEIGDLQPTVKQLREAAHVFGRSLATLLMAEPPDEPPLPVTDFRRVNADGAPSWSPLLIAAARRALQQRATLLELAEAAADLVNLGRSEFAFDDTASDEALGEALRGLLELDDFPTPVWRRGSDALNATVTAAERLGVIVIQVQRVPLAEMKGFSIARFPFPIVALNGADYPRPKLFTLLHEMAHIGLRAGGVCDLHEMRGVGVERDVDRLERRCNAIAASALMPRAAFLTEQAAIGGAAGNWQLEDLRKLGERFGASAEAALLRLISTGSAAWDLYRLRKPEIDAAFEEAREEEKAKRAARDDAGGPSFYVMRVRDLGHAYVTAVIDAFSSEAISSRDVASLLRVRYDQLGKLREAAGR